jgi:SagB-type dehydrogenase family enzyme
LGNLEIDEATRYHEETKHSEVSVRSSAHFLDWESKPLQYKIYPRLAPTPLPKNFPHPSQDTLECVEAYESTGSTVDVESVAELLYFSAGITKKIRFLTGEVHAFRAAAATGALYEVEVYVVCGKNPGLDAGVYHFNPQDFALRKLRAGDYRYYLHEATSKSGEISLAPLSLILTAIHWRNAWKYQARSYRHFFWDSGTILANLLATAVSAQLKAKVVVGFVDDSVNRLLGLDTRHEAATVLVPLGSEATTSSSMSMREPLDVPAIFYEYEPLSKREIEYPEILKMHTASTLNSPGEVTDWLKTPPRKTKPEVRGEFFPLQPLLVHDPSPLAKTISRRGSTRAFCREGVPFDYLSTILECSTRGIPADFLGPSGGTLIDVYLIVNAVEKLQPGAYYYDQEEKALELLKAGNFREISEYLCLEQPLAADGSVVTFLMSNLNDVLNIYGNRGYRTAQLEAGIIMGKMYLCAYALGLGATGITFYDDAVTDFFSPHTVTKSSMLSVIIGVPAYRRRPKSLKDS